jgi:uncharacterized membrane protein
MKKLFLMLFLMIPMILFAQDPTEPTQPPTGWQDILINPGVWLGSFAGVSFLTAFVAAFLNGLLKIVKGFPKQLTAWLVAIIIVVASDLLNFGYAKDYTILFAVVNGFFAGLASNGWFDIPTLKAVLNSIEGWFKPKP